MLKFCSYNCLNFKANTSMIKKCIYENDACFFIEHWLNSQEKFLFEDICKGEYNIFFHSDYDISEGPLRGRPHGGLCWVIHKRLNLTSQVLFNQNISKVSIEVDNNKMNLYGVWFPYDDNTKERLCTFKSNISLINAQMKMHKAEETVVIGDFNADLERGKRFDLLLKKFVNKNHMYDGIGHLKKYTYKKGEYTAKLDHILLRDKSSLTVSSCSILDSLLDASDHKPIQVILN